MESHFGYALRKIGKQLNLYMNSDRQQGGRI